MVISPQRLARISQVFALLCVGIILAWVLAQGVYAVASVDDFCYGNRGAHDGVLNTVMTEYFSWGGRYSSTVLIAWFASHPNVLTHYYFLCPFIILAANFAASGHLLKRIGMESRSFLFIFFVLLIASYSLRQSVFWLSGGITYGLACAVFIAIIAEEFTLFTKENAPAISRVVLLSFASLILAGFNETIMIAHIALLATLFCISYERKRKITRAIGVILLFAIVGAVIVYLAPGNDIRGVHFPHRNLLLSVIKSFFWLFWKYGIFFFPTVVVFYCALVLFAPKMKEETSSVYAMYFKLALFMGLWGSAFTRFYAKSSSGADRTHTVDYALVTILALMAALHHYRERHADIQKAMKHLYEAKLLPHVYIILVGTFLTFVIRPVMDPFIIKTALHDIKYAAEYKKYTMTRINTLKNTPQDEISQLPDYPHKQQALTFFDDVTADPEDWRNTCFASYYSLNKVQLTAPLPEE